MNVQGVQWNGTQLSFIDQTLLPGDIKTLALTNIDQAIEAILTLRVRGAPAIAMFASYTLALELRKIQTGDATALKEKARELAQRLVDSRPTAVNLSHAMKEMIKAIDAATDASGVLLNAMTCAETIYAEDKRLCARLGEYGSSLIPQGARIITYCNTGSLTTAGIGTAIGAFKTAHDQKKDITVFPCETRPLLQGSRLTSWELDAYGIKTILITDNMAAHILKTEKIDLVMVGADRITSRGDTANKIGTFGLAVLARHFNVPFYVVAPGTSVDPSISDGSSIHIEERAAQEVRGFGGKPVAPSHVAVRNPAFDVTPAELISAIVTESGVFKPPYNFK